MALRRDDGRDAAHLRAPSIELGVLRHADGSASVRASSAGAPRAAVHVCVGVHGPRPAKVARLERPDRMTLDFLVSPAAGSAGADERALEATLNAVFEQVVVLSAHPRCVVNVSIQLCSPFVPVACLSASAITATSLALADAGVPMRCLALGMTVGLLPVLHGSHSTALIVDPSPSEASACIGTGTYAWRSSDAHTHTAVPLLQQVMGMAVGPVTLPDSSTASGADVPAALRSWSRVAACALSSVSRSAMEAKIDRAMLADVAQPTPTRGKTAEVS